MLGKLGGLTLTLGLALAASAGDMPGLLTSASISGYVRAANGVPQMGAAVEVLGSALNSLRVFTDENGFYYAGGLRPGSYSIKVSAPSFLPALREQIGLSSGAKVMLNVTLNTLFDAVQSGPARGVGDEDDWKWVLRSSANRAILRILDASSRSQASGPSPEGLGGELREVKGSVAFVAGSPSEGFGSTSDMSTDFSLERPVFSDGTLALQGDVGYGDGVPDAVLRVSYSREMANGSEPQMAVTVRHLASPDLSLRNSDLEALDLTMADKITLGDVLELKFGSNLQTIQFMGRVNSFRPFGSATVHLSPNTFLAYRYAAFEPSRDAERDFDSAGSELGESAPRMSIADFVPSAERDHHHEISLNHRAGDTSLQFAAYSDRVLNPALTGVGEFSSDGGDVLPDIYSGTFTYQGRDFETHGLRVVLERKLSADVMATLDYGYGGVLDLDKTEVSLADGRSQETVEQRHSVTGKISGTLPHAKTRWIASYGWVSGQALAPVDMFNASAGRADPYLDVFFKQPIPGTGFLPCHMDAVVDVRNLLAQGYIPVVGPDGHTVYLVQSARAIRGGVAFTF